MSEVKQKLRSSKQTDLTSLSEGPDSKKRKSPAKSKGAGKNKKQKDSTSEADLVQATVEDLSAAEASKSNAKLVDPNTGEEVQDSSQIKAKPSSNSKTAAKPKSKAKGKQAGEVVNPNTGETVDATEVSDSKPAAKPGSSKKVKAESTSKDQAGPSTSSGKADSHPEAEQYVKINRAPVLTLWVAVVAERQGFSKEAGMTFGKAISGMLAQSKGRSIGVFDKKDTDDGVKQEKEEQEHEQGIAKHDVFGMSIKAKDVGDDGDVRAMDTNMKALNHKQVEGYLQRAFGDQLQDAKGSLVELANSYKPEEIGECCYHLYEQFRPTVASGQKGWGQKGQLDLAHIRHLAQQH